jgi:hypothetical protein
MDVAVEYLSVESWRWKETISAARNSQSSTGINLVLMLADNLLYETSFTPE